MAKKKAYLFFLGALLCCFFFLFFVSAASQVKTVDNSSLNSLVVPYNFQEPVVSNGEGIISVLISGLDSYMQPNEPVLPMKIAQILIPRGKNVGSVTIKYSDGNKIANGKARVANFPIMINETENPLNNLVRVPLVGNYPKNLIDWWIGEMHGNDIVSVPIYPVIYNSDTQDFYFSSSITVIITFTSENNAQPMVTTRSLASNIINEQDKKDILGFVDNPNESFLQLNDGGGVRAMANGVLPLSQTYPYLIITSSALADAITPYNFSALINQKQTRNFNPINGTIVTVESILADSRFYCNGQYGDGCPISNPTLFNDTAAMIRNYIKYAYNNLGTRYVLFGGDVSIIPVRSFYVSVPGYVDNIPSDLYYANLDGSMNANNDSIWGWTNDNPDFLSEVYVGRAPVETTTELANFVRKTILYENLTSSRSNYTANVLNIYDPSVDSLTVPTAYLSSNGFNVNSQAHSYIGTDDGWIPNYLGSFLANPSGLPAIINQAGHGSFIYISGFGFSDKVTNNTYPNFFYGQACDWGGFDASDSLAENLIYRENMSYAILANSRYGWYSPGCNCGPGSVFMNSFWYEVLYNDVGNLGRANQLSKEASRTSWWDYGLWTYWTQNLLGDPEVSFYYYPHYANFSVLIQSPIANKYYGSSNIFLDLNNTQPATIWWNFNGTNITYSVPLNYSFPAGNITLIAYSNESSGTYTSQKNITFFVDLNSPNFINTTLVGSFQRNTMLDITINASDNLGISQETIETDATGTMTNYTVADNLTNSLVFPLGTVLNKINITTTQNNFSYRSSAIDLAGNTNVTNWVVLNLVNTPPAFVGNSSISFFIYNNYSLNLSQFFNDVDLDILNFTINNSGGINYTLINDNLTLHAINDSQRTGLINVVVNDSKNISSAIINFTYILPSISGLTNFTGNTLNVSNLTSYLDVPLFIENDYGRINFTSVNLTYENISFGTDIRIWQGSYPSVFVNSTKFLGLNSSANITLFNISYSSPVIYRDSYPCLEGCSNISYNSSSGIFVFGVGGFSLYEIRPNTCSDGIKNGQETGADCGGICSACVIPSSGTSGGGSGGVISASTFVISNSQLAEGYSKSLRVGDQIKFQIKNLNDTLDNHTLTLTKNGLPIEILIASSHIILNFNIGEERKINITSSKSYDLLVKFNNISENKVNLTLRSINELIVFNNTSNVDTTISESNGQDANSNKFIKLGSYFSLANVLFSFEILVIVILVFLFIRLMGKKRELNKHPNYMRSRR